MKKQLTKKVTTFIIMMFSITLTSAQWVSKAAGMPSSPQLGINEMIAVNSQVAWGFAYERNNAFVNPLTNFTRTIDGGKHWIAGNISSQPDQFIVGLAPLSASTAYVVSSDINFSGKVLKTTNGGVTWTQLNVAPFPMFYENIYFFNANDGVVLGDTNLSTNDGFHAIFITNDGGTNWMQVPAANIPVQDPAEAFYPFSMEAAGNTIWTVSTTAHVWKSVDKGLHWVSNPTDRSEAVTSNLKMRDAMHGLWGIEGELYRTTDGGVTWIEVNLTGTFFTFDLAYVPGTASTYISTGGDTSDVDFFTGGLHGLGSSYSVDDGNTWITIDTAVDHLAIDMVSPIKGFCGGFNTGTSDGVFNYEGPALGYSCGNNHTYMCHHGHTICVANNKILKHLLHGDYLGACVPNYRSGGESNVEEINLTDENVVLTVFPNPFSSSTTVSFTLYESQNVSLMIFDLNGRLIKTLAHKTFEEGEHQIEFNAEKINAGIYFLKMQTGEFLKTEKLIVTK
ncbi:MAG: T9SS type A sorting domain-containing protein [Bacteroidia bacterium]